MCIFDQFPGVMACSTFKSIPLKKKKKNKYWERIARGRNEKGSNGIEKTVIGASNRHIFRKKKKDAKVRHNSIEYSLCV